MNKPKNILGGQGSGQVSLEMLLIVAFLFITLIPFVYFMYIIFAEQAWKVDLQQAKTVTDKMAEYSDKLSVGGEGATGYLYLYFPSKTRNVSSIGRTIIVTSEVPNLGLVDQVSIAKEPISLLGSWDDANGMQMVHFNYSKGNVTIYR